MTDPEVIETKKGTAMVKLTLFNQKFNYNGEPQGEEIFKDIVAFKDVATNLMMLTAGEIIDCEGVINQNVFDTKFKKGIRGNNFVLNSYKISEE